MHNLAHSIFDNNQPKALYKILSDGFLKSSSKTKNSKLFGYEKGSQYVFLKIPIGVGVMATTLILDEKLLLEHSFYLHTNWSGKVDKSEKKYIGKELSLSELSKVLHKFEKDIEKNGGSNSLMSNEILVKNNISLKKYLLEIRILKKHIDDMPELLEYIKSHYKNVKVTYI
jgi:hypothetical protein